MGNNEEVMVAIKENGTRVILIVEDEETISDFMVRFLEEETPYRAISVINALEALELVNSIKPDLFILDYQIPGLNGIELFDRLHVMKGLEAVPALMFSASKVPFQPLHERGIPFLKKPFDLGDLLRVVEELLLR